MTSNRSFSLAIILGAFIVAGALIARPAVGTKTTSIGQGDIGVVDVYSLVDILIMSEEASQQRSDFESRSNATITEYEQRLIGIRAQMSTMTQDDPNSGQLYAQYQQVTQQIQQATNQINEGYQVLLANQIADAYKTIHAAVNEIAGDQGYTFVLATRRGADLVQTSSLTGVTQEILARPLVTPPEAVDMTESVRIHLGLPTLEEITAEAQAAAEAAAAQEQAEEQEAAEPTPATEITDE
jgi:Skp family chaperone for outer membrane proteins